MVDQVLVSCSPLLVVGAREWDKDSIDAVSMLLSSNTTISLLPPAPGGMLAAVMAMPMAHMPAPFDWAGPSQGGREGIFALKENILHRNLGSTPIVLTPFLRIPPSDWHGNET
jgi:hypothetical protein